MTGKTPFIVAVCVLASNCGDASDTNRVGPTPPPPVSFEECQADDAAFVRSAILASLGRHPKSQAEVRLYVDLLASKKANLSESEAKAELVQVIMSDPEFSDRWADHFMDALRVQRIEVQTQRTCYGDKLRDDDNGALAEWVRDHSPKSDGDGIGPFTMRDLLRSAIALDDISPLYRAHLFALVNKPIPGANVSQVELELARREDFGAQFDASYLNRDIVCLECHSSTQSITYHPDPELNRHWALEGDFESALFGQPQGIDVSRAHAPFRYSGFVKTRSSDEPGHAPWGWKSSCGSFSLEEVAPDPADVDGFFGQLRGKDLTVFDLSLSLSNGFKNLSEQGLKVEPDGSIFDANAAFAYLVAANVVEGVWEEVIGSPLTIANYFPRNKDSRDLLQELTDDFVASNYSIKALIAHIVSTPYFNRAAPSNGCGEGPYNMPPVYDPWTIADDDAEKRKNGPGDSVFPLSPRVLMRAAYAALDWERPYFSEFPERPFAINFCKKTYSCEEMATVCLEEKSCCSAYDFVCENPPDEGQPSASQSRAFQRGIGVFLKNGEPGFRGLDFQARLVFENRFGTCRNPGNSPDYIARLVERALASDATVGHAVLTLKDRLVGKPTMAQEEQDLIERLLGIEFGSPASKAAQLDFDLRRLCGTLIGSPQFVLGGLPHEGLDVDPMLIEQANTYQALCEDLADRAPVTCTDPAQF